MFFHYVMYEAEEDPETAPTLVWYNGGPGSPSTFGLFQELGPLYVNVDSEKTSGCGFFFFFPPLHCCCVAAGWHRC